MTAEDCEKLAGVLGRLAEMNQKDPTMSWRGSEFHEGYDAGLRYVQALLRRMKALAEDPETEPHNGRGDLMTIEEWKESCEDGSVADGHGRVATSDGFTRVPVLPRERDCFEFPAWATHIVWYNS
jgi:hypothetical protein